MILSNKDEVHYERVIGADHDLYTKMIFVIKSQEIYEKAIECVENYSNFLKEVNNIRESIGGYTIKQAIFIIVNIYRAHEEDDCNELIPSWHKTLNDSLETLKNVDDKNQSIYDYIGYAEYFLSDMPLLKIYSIA